MGEILEMCKQISAEHDPAKLVLIIGKLRKLLAAEQQSVTCFSTYDVDHPLQAGMTDSGPKMFAWFGMAHRL
jgi:hypothetical protein